jgi:hypothetical protein
MGRKIFATALSFFVLLGLAAQPASKQSGWAFHSINEIGLLQGESKAAVHLQSVNGFQRHNLFIGLGAGLDYYRYKSVPLFGEARKYFGKSRNQFFVYADAGTNIVWEKQTSSVYYAEKYHPAFYGATGIGYKAGFKNGMGFLLSAGYSFKRVNDYRQQQELCYNPGLCNLETDNYKFDLNRLLLQVGWMF